MRLTVLGSSASYAGAGRATAGYLVEHGPTRVLLECGHGVLANLASHVDPASLDAVIVSHAHPDHVVDLYALQALLRYAPEGPLGRMRLLATEGLLARMGGLLSGRGAEELAEAFAEEAMSDGTRYQIGDLSVTAWRVDHGDETYAVTIEDGSGARMAYLADGPADAASVRIAEGADLLLAEATLPQQYAGRAPHMTASEAAQVAERSGAGSLVLTHVWPTTDRGTILREAQAVFDRQIVVAEEHAAIEIASDERKRR